MLMLMFVSSCCFPACVLQPAEDLIREIAVLELEVKYLEKHLLAMYRERFAEWLAAISATDDRGNGDSDRHDWIMFRPMQKQKECDNNLGATKLDDSSILRCQSSLSHTACSFRNSSLISEAADYYHSLPMSLQQYCVQESTANHVDDLCSAVPLRVHESPNWLSEEMIKCISAIYCKLANPSSAVESNVLRFQTKEHSSFHSDHSWSGYPFHMEESFATAVELRGLCRDGQSLNRIQHMLQRFR